VLEQVRFTRALHVLALCAAFVARPAAAQEDSGERIGPRPLGQNDARAAARAGAFLRWTDAATTSTHAVTIESHGGYDTTREGATAEARGEAVILSDATGRRTRGVPLGLGVFGGGVYASGPQANTDLTSGFGGLKLQPLFQETLGIDAALAVSYHSRGFSLRPVVVAEVLLGRRFGETQLLFNAGYSQPTDSDERSGSARAAVTTRVVGDLRAGLDSKASFDLELDEEEPAGEPELEVLAGPAVGYAIGHVAVSATGGVSALRLRDGNDTRVGATMALGLGGAF
jgi:hypothetical protein